MACVQREPQRKANRGETRERPRRGARDTVLVVGLLIGLAVVVAAAHHTVLSAEAVSFDDTRYLFENPVLQRPGLASARAVLVEVLASSTVEGYYEPLSLISLMVDVARGGRIDHLRPFHETNLALHVINAVLAALLLHGLLTVATKDETAPADDVRRSSARAWAAALSGLLFGLHPMTVEPVAWVWERKTLLAAAFALGSLILYVHYARRGRRALYVASLALFLLALMSKPTTTPLPILMLVLDFWPLRRLSRRALAEKIPFLLLAGVFAAVTIISTARTSGVTAPDDRTVAETLLKIPYLIAFYLGKIAWPASLSPVYVLPEPMALSQARVLVGMTAAAVLFALTLWSLRRTRALAAGGLFFVLAILPTLGLVGYSWVGASDKYVYLPMIGLLLPTAWLLFGGWLGTAIPLRAALMAIVLVLSAAESVVTHRCLARWQDTDRLIAYALDLAPNSAEMHNNSGWAAARRGDRERAVRDFTRAIELRPRFAEAFFNRGTVHLADGEFDRAIADFTEAVRLAPRFVAAYGNRGLAHRGKGDYVRAIEDFTRAVDLAPADPVAWGNRGNAYAAVGEHDKALADLTRAVELRPDSAAAYVNRAFACVRAGAFDRAAVDYTRAIELAPDDADLWLHRGNARSALGLHEDAARDYTRAIALRPDHAAAYHNRALAHLALRKHTEARADAEACRRLGGDLAPELLAALNAATSRP